MPPSIAAASQNVQDRGSPMEGGGDGIAAYRASIGVARRVPAARSGMGRRSSLASPRNSPGCPRRLTPDPGGMSSGRAECRGSKQRVEWEVCGMPASTGH